LRVPASGVLCLALALSLDIRAQDPKPYLAPISLQVQQVEPVVTAGESVGRYKACGAPAGLWAERGTQGMVTLSAAHALGADQGAGRAHGARGAFLSQWQVKAHFDSQGLLTIVREGRDAVRKVAERSSRSPFGRIVALAPCDGGLLFAEAESGSGTADGRRGGRVWLVADGKAQPQPALGRCGWEGLAYQRGGPGALLLATGSGSGRIYLFAGAPDLSGGTLYVLAVEGLPVGASPREKGRLFRVRLLSVNGTQEAEGLEREAASKGASLFVHPAGAAADPSLPGNFWFTTLGGEARDAAGRLLDHNGRLFGLRLDDPADPAKGGTLAVLLDGDEGVVSPAAVAADRRGRLLLAEAPTFPPPGRDTSLWLYDPRSEAPLVRLAEVAQGVGGTKGGNGAWGLGGVADASTSLGAGWWLVSVATRSAARDPEVCEGGQLLALHLAEPAN